MATILIVDDLISNRKVLTALLIGRGHRLVEAADGRAGLAAVRAERPDLVITDVLMPLVDGYELVRQLRLDPATSGIPVLFYTAPYGEREARALARASGVPYVLTKPPRPDEVLKIVDRVLAGVLETDTDADRAAEAALDREQLQLLSDQLSETAEELRLANARLRALINIGLDFAAQRNGERRLQRLSDAVHDLFGASYVTIGIAGAADRRVRRVVGSGLELAPWIKVGDVLQGIVATVVSERRATRGRVAANDAAPRPFPDHHPEAQDYLVAPITSPVNVYGWICLVCNEGRAFTVGEERQVLALAGHLGRIYELEHEVADRLEAEAALEHSERLNRNLLAHLPHRILVKDRHSVVVFCNTNFARDLGLRVADVIGKDTFALHPPALAEAYAANDRQVMETGVLQHLEEPYQVDGQQRWVHTVKVPYRDEDGRVTGVLVVFDDITERRQLEQQVQQSQKMEAVGELAGGVAHDFNNLLTAILGYCELILDDLAADDPHRRDIDEIQKAGQRAAELTRQLLAFSRKEIITPTTLDLNAVVGDMRTMLDRLIREDVKILVGLSHGLALVTADRGQIEQIVINLAVNARDAMPDGGTLTIQTATVEIDADTAQQHRALSPGPHVSLTVSDTGSGMTADVKARIFEPFFTTKPRGRGTGLGLASVQGTIARSGGSISVSSEIGAGSTFQVLLPRADAGVATPVIVPVLNPLTGTETVLVVEDADQLRSLISLLLKRQGYTVLVAANADEAKRQFAGHAAIDVMLTDVVMPGASGPELTRELQASRPALKVIYMSGYTQDAIVQHGVLLPGITFLPKPFTADTLGRKIRSVLDQ